MSSFDERKKGFEKKFVHDEEIEFKISARKVVVFRASNQLKKKINK